MMIFKLVILCFCIGIATGFMCYACSWGGTDTEIKDAHPACLDSLDQLPPSSHIKCGNFCVTQEQFDKHKKRVISFVRTCNVDWGNQCSEDAWWVICKTTCVGDFCNALPRIDLTDKNIPTRCDPIFGCKGSGSLFNGSSQIHCFCLKVYLYLAMLLLLCNAFT